MENLKVKNRLSLKSLPFFLSSNDQKPKRFMEQEKGVVGLGIVVALNNNECQNTVFSVSPRSDPIPIFSTNRNINDKADDDVDIELLEEYTCVISHAGNNLIKKREYFDDGCERKIGVNSYWVSSINGGGGSGGYGGGGVFCAPSPPVVVGGGGVMVFDDVDFLRSCYLCKKKLHGLDIFMYRGEKAFCSEECRYKQISTDECKEKYGSKIRKQTECIDNLCSSPMQFPAGMAVA